MKVMNWCTVAVRVAATSGRAVAYMMDDVLLAGTRTLSAKPSDWIITGTPQSSEA